MTPHLDGPCPCGSGRTYRSCCGFGRELFAHTPGRRASPSPAAAWKARAAREWQADLIPVPSPGRAGGRPVLALVVAGGIVLDAGLSESVGWDPKDQARLLEEALDRAAAVAGKWPKEVFLRHREHAEVLAPGLARKRTRVSSGFLLHDLEMATLDWMEHTFAAPPWPPTSRVSRWAEWGLDPERVAEFFAAWARFNEAEPWFLLPEWRSLRVTPMELGEFVSILGVESMQRGLALHAGERDVATLFPTDGVYTYGGPISALVVFSRTLADLPATMQRELLTSGWDVAAPDAYPFIRAYGTPGGAISDGLLRHLTTLCLNLAELAEATEGRLEEPHPIEWEARGLRMHLPPDLPGTPALTSLVSALMTYAPRADEIEVHPPEGANTLAEGMAAWIEGWMEDRRRTADNTLSGLAPRQLISLLKWRFRDNSPLQVAEDLESEAFADAHFVQNARLFLDILVEGGGTRQTARGNLNMAFVRRMVDAMHHRDEERKRNIHVMMPAPEHRIREVHTLRVVLELAGLVERQGRRFLATPLGVEVVEQDRLGLLAARTFRTFFDRLDPTLLDGASPRPVFQYILPLAFWRMGVEALDWLGTRRFADRVLPGALGLKHWDHIFDLTLVPVQNRIIQPLLDFGLLESRPAQRDEPSILCRPIEVRVTPLYHRMLRFEWAEGD